MDYETEKKIPTYVQQPLKPGEIRILSFEIETKEVVEKDFASHGLRVVQAWSNGSFDRVQIDSRGNLRFIARPGSTVFAAIKSA